MMDMVLASQLGQYVWSAMASGVVGNAAYDGIKAALGNGFDRLAQYVNGQQKAQFDAALFAVLETNEAILAQLRALQTAHPMVTNPSTVVSGGKNVNTGYLQVGGGIHIGDVTIHR